MREEVLLKGASHVHDAKSTGELFTGGNKGALGCATSCEVQKTCMVVT